MAMKPSTGRRLAVLAASALAVGATLLTTLPSAGAAPAAHASTAQLAPPVVAGSAYLALGDSVPFGYREQNSIPTPDYTNPQSFTGYPEMVAQALKLKLTNAACPGETTSSFLNTTKPSNGCENAYRQIPGSLKAPYKRSQMRFALRFLNHHPNTRLVTVMLGANDGLLCINNTPDHCTNPTEMAAVLDTIAKNMTTILGNIRNAAHYTGQIVVVNYYSLDYRSAQQNQLAQFLNATVDKVAKHFGAKLAGTYKAFKTASDPAGGDNCAAGLFTFLSGGGCGIHPSLGGQALIANAVETKVRLPHIRN